MTTYSTLNKVLYYWALSFSILILYFGIFTIADAASWYVRPEGGDYGTENGSSYANAFDGFYDVVWGTGGVQGGDTLYVCGTHIRTSKSNANIASQGGFSVEVSGTANAPTALDGSCPGGEKGIIWGAYKDERSGGMRATNWSEIQNGVYFNESSNYHKAFVSHGLFEDIKGDTYKKYQQVETLDEVLNSSKSGVFYIESAATNRHKVWVRPFSESTFKDNMYWSGAGAWFIWFPSTVSNVEIRNLKFLATTWSLGGSLDNPVDHYTFKNVTLYPLQAGTAIIPNYVENVTFDGLELAYSGTGIYFWYRTGTTFKGKYASDITIKNSYFHDIGIPWGGLNPTGAAADGHGIGVQNQERWYIYNNRFERIGSAIDFHLGGSTSFTNRDVEIVGNYIYDMRKDYGRVAPGYGIVFEGHHDMPKGQTSGLLVANNIILKCDGKGIGSSRKDTVSFYNNTVAGCRDDFALAGNRVDGASAHAYNNIALKPSDNYFYFNQNATDIQYEFEADNNAYYPDPTTANRFHFLAGGVSTSGINPWAWPGWKDGHARYGDIVETNTIVTNPFPHNSAGNYASVADVTPSAYSPVVDAGKDVGRTTDYFGNPIYGTPDIGAIEYQPPYKLGSNNLHVPSSIRIYGDGKFRYLAQPSGSPTAAFAIVPQSGFSTSNTKHFADINVTGWGTTKSWTVSNGPASGTFTFIVGNVTANAKYALSVEGTQNSVVTANGSGVATFTYTGNLATAKKFSVAQTSAAPTPSPTPTPTPTGDLIAHLTFDKADTTTSAKDKSGNSNDGTFSGFTSPTLVAGALGDAISIDGINDYINISSVRSTLAGDTTASFALWIKSNKAYVNSTLGSILGVNSGTGGNVAIMSIGHNGSGNAFDNELSMFDGAQSAFEGDTNSVVADNTWHHVAYVRNGSTGTLYVDGVAKSTHTPNYNFASTDKWSLGNDFDGTSVSDLYQGALDDVRIYRKALTASEVKALYDARTSSTPSPSPSVGLIGHWTFDDIDVGSDVKDKSGQGNNGTFSGFTSPTLVPGALGEAMQFDGTNDQVRIGGFSKTLLPATISAWVYTDDPGSCDGVVFSRSGASVGLNVGTCGDASKVGYHWNLSTTYGWKGGSSIPVGEWFLYTLVVEPGKATAYVHSADGKNVTTNTTSHAASLINDLRIGGDELSSGRHFKGLIDDVRIYDKALSASEIDALFAASSISGSAPEPTPEPGTPAVAKEVYVESKVATGKCVQPVSGGSDLIAATCDSSSAQEVVFVPTSGNKANLKVNGQCITPKSGSLTNGTRLTLASCGGHAYQEWIEDGMYLRNAANTNQVMDLAWPSYENVILWKYGGSINQQWSFTEVPAPASIGLIGHWTFDDIDVGSDVEDKSGQGNNGTFSGFSSPTLVEGPIGEAMQFDGSNDEVRISGFNETLTAATLSAWMYTDSPESCDGVVFSRGNNTIGLNAGMCGDASRVGYHWNTRDSYIWKGPEFPAGEWFLYTLVVEPGKATAYVHTKDGVDTAVNTIAHAEADLNDLRIGGDENSSGRHFKGLVDDVRIYDKALSASEIDALFATGDLSAPDVTYRYVRWTVTDRRGSGNSIQASEFELLLDGSKVAWPSGTNASNPGGSNPTNEDPANAIDGGTGKWLDFNFDKDGGDALKGSSALVIDAGSGKSVTFNGYRWRTANDYTDRDPVGWKVEGSNDGSSWTLLDEQTGESVPLTRHEFTNAYELGSGQVLGASTLNDLMGEVLGVSSQQAQLASLQAEAYRLIAEIQDLIKTVL